MSDIHVVILAAGQGTRMKSRLPKVLHAIAGRPMVEHVLRTAESVSPATITLIVGHRADIVRERLAGPAPAAVRRPGAAAGHGARAAAGGTGRWRGARARVVLLSGDVPLLRPDTLAASGRDPPGGQCRGHRRHRHRRAAVRLRPHRPHRGPHRADRRGAGRLAGGAADPRDQQRHLRLRPGAALRRPAGHRVRRTRRASST